jgi:major inositol transporter-like SP family MFS transporter
MHRTYLLAAACRNFPAEDPWIANTIVSLVFPILINTIQGTTISLFAVINVGTLIFYIRSIPETKDRSLETVEEELKLRFTGQIPLTRP